MPADGYVFGSIMVAGTVPTLAAFAGFSSASGLGFDPVTAANGSGSMTGTQLTPITRAAITLVPYCALT